MPFFSDEQIKFINGYLPNIQNKEYDKYFDEEIEQIEEETETVLLSCFGKDDEPMEGKESILNMCYSIIDKIGDT